MKILVINKFNMSIIVESGFIPRIGDAVDLFYSPSPIVTHVLAWPSSENLDKLGINVIVDAIITVE